jgi:hypothetical protein
MSSLSTGRWAKAVYDPNGLIYEIPEGSSQFLIINPNNNTISIEVKNIY